MAGASACPDLATGARETGREPGDPGRLGRQRGWGNMASPVLFLEDAGEWGHGKKSSIFSQSRMADFRFPRARRGRQQDASPGRVPVIGPLLLHAGLAPSCPHRPRPPPLCPPSILKGLGPLPLSAPHYQDCLPQAPCPVHPRPQDEPRESRASTPVLCARPSREGRGLGPHNRTWPGPAWSQSLEKKRRAGPSHTRTEGGPTASGHGPPSPAPCQAG